MARPVWCAHQVPDVSFREGVELVSAIKWGHCLGILSGLTDGEIYSLLYRIQTAHLIFLSRQEELTFEDDVVTSVQKADRLRSIILQEAVSQVQLIA